MHMSWFYKGFDPSRTAQGMQISFLYDGLTHRPAHRSRLYGLVQISSQFRDLLVDRLGPSTLVLSTLDQVVGNVESGKNGDLGPVDSLQMGRHLTHLRIYQGSQLLQILRLFIAPHTIGVTEDFDLDGRRTSRHHALLAFRNVPPN